MIYSTNSKYDTEDFLEGCEPNRSFPHGALIDEMVFYTLEASEADFNEMMMNVGLTELSCLESTGEEMVYEGGKLESLRDSAVKFLQDMWKRVQAMIQSAMEWFQKQSDKVRNGLIKKLNEKDIKAKVKNIKGDKSFGSSYEYTDIVKYANGIVSDIRKGDSAVTKLYEKAAAKVQNGKNADTDDLASKIDDQVKYVRRTVFDSGESTSAAKEALKKSIRGREVTRDGAWVKKNWSKVVDEIQSYPESKKAIKNSYEALRKDFNDTIKDVRREAGLKGQFEASIYTKAIKGHKDLRQLSVIAEQALLSCLSERYSFMRSIVLKVVGSAKPKNESAPVAESTTSDRIASLFEW